MPRDPLLVVIVGPTASAKTALSLELATRFHGEIVNCDSVAMYREFRIGTAKPTAQEQARAPHHLFDVIEPTGFTTAGEYARGGREVLREIQHRGALPIVVGGTGLYLRALLKGLFPGPQRSEELRERLRQRAQEKSSKYLHGILRRTDPKAAAKIHDHWAEDTVSGHGLVALKLWVRYFTKRHPAVAEILDWSFAVSVAMLLTLASLIANG